MRLADNVPTDLVFEAFQALAPEGAAMSEVLAHAAGVSFRTVAMIPVATELPGRSWIALYGM